MHVNFKYFVVTIGSIFLALGVGIIIGTNMGTNEAVQRQNQAIVDDINKQVAAVKTRDSELTKLNKKYTDDIGLYNKYIEANKAVLTSNKLAGKTVGIISFTNKNIGTSIEKEIISSGGTVGFSIQIGENLFDKNSIDKLNKELSLNLKNINDVVNLVNDAIRNSNNSGILTKLTSMGYMTVNNFNSQFDGLTNIVVVNPQNTNSKSNNDNPVLSVVKFMKNDKSVVVVQTKSTPEDKINPFINMKVSTINDIDHTSGEISLINCLSNENIIGNYGFNKGVDDGVTTIAVGDK